jgi:hypothetical protein
MLGSLTPSFPPALCDQLVDHADTLRSRSAQLAPQSLQDLLTPLEHQPM